MALEYGLGEKLEPLAPIKQEHALWFRNLTHMLFYGSSDARPERPEIFMQWLQEAKEKEIVVQSFLDAAAEKYYALHVTGEEILKFFEASGQKPEATLYDKLLGQYQDFLDAVDDIESEALVRELGIDPDTGIRSKAVLFKDLEKELERFSRNGKQFTVAIVRVDDYENMLKSKGEVEAKAMIRQVADLIKKSMRSFDDAYMYDDDKFVLSLKQANIPGGIKAMDRLRLEMEEEKVMLEIDGVETPLTLSCCVAEPTPGDKISELLYNLNEDLKVACKEPDTVLQFHEMSPLERFVQATE